jgi:hypothetical protein
MTYYRALAEKQLRHAEAASRVFHELRDLVVRAKLINACHDLEDALLQSARLSRCWHLCSVLLRCQSIIRDRLKTWAFS